MQSKAMKILLPIGLILVALAITVVLIKTRPHAERQKPPTPRPRVSVVTTGQETAPILVKGFGSVKAKRSVQLTPQVSGEVLARSSEFESGGFFSQGDVLLEIDDTDYRLALARADADVAQAKVNLATAEEEAQSAQQEWEEIGGRDTNGEKVAPSSLVLREPQLKLAQASLESAKAARRQAEVNLGRCTVVAPFAGRVLETSTDVGQYIRAGVAIGIIYAIDLAQVSVPVPDEDLAWITLAGKDGSPASEVTVSAQFSGAIHTWPGRAVRLGGAVDARSRLVPVLVEVDNPYVQEGQRPPLVEGMFVEVTFASEVGQSGVVIPRTALRPGNLVWVVDQDAKVKILPVQVARADVDVALISSGLEHGMDVITNNLQFVTPGMMVQVEGRPQGQKGGE